MPMIRMDQRTICTLGSFAPFAIQVESRLYDIIDLRLLDSNPSPLIQI